MDAIKGATDSLASLQTLKAALKGRDIAVVGADLAKAMGGQGYTVKNTEDFYDIFVQAKNWANKNNLPALLHIKTGSEMVLPGKRFSSL